MLVFKFALCYNDAIIGVVFSMTERGATFVFGTLECVASGCVSTVGAVR